MSSGRPVAAAQALASAGFALQLPAQLPILHAIMSAVRSSEFAGPVVNCSYPDVTHQVLARQGLAPTIGIGNAGMIAKVIEAGLRRAGTPERVRVLAHHSHVTAAMTAAPARAHVLAATSAGHPGAAHPRVWLGEEARAADALAYQGPALASSRELNALSCTHAVELTLALLGLGPALLTSAPGPHGRPGGWPVRVAQGEVTLALPQELSQAEATAWNQAAAAGDGLERIDDDGTVHFTEAARRALADHAPALAAPLPPTRWRERAELLRQYVEAA